MYTAIPSNFTEFGIYDVPIEDSEEHEEHEISEWLKEKCLDLWDIYIDRYNEIEKIGDTATSGYNRILLMDEYIKENWDRKAMLEYRMGTIYKEDNGVIHYALIHCISKISALNYILTGTSNNFESASRRLNECKHILTARNKNELLLAHIQNIFNFWNSLTDEELLGI